MELSSAIIDKPPAVLDCAQVLHFAHLNESVKYTARGCMIVDGVTLDPVPCLVVAKNIADDAILLFYCSKDWQVLGAGGYDTIFGGRRKHEPPVFRSR